MSIVGFHREEIILAARKKGRQAQLAGAPLSDNPYRQDAPNRDSDKAWHWTQGYLASEHEQRREREEKDRRV